tara:strand:- start:468 stop:845 length:378 start_codon:yes stop_codon:yes gene_type:complete
MENKNPLSPHIEVYSWHISSLISISNRITGVINILAITLICIWITSLTLGENNYEITKLFLKSFFGKFLILGIIWSFCFQILAETRHLIMDLGYGFEIKIANISGLLVIFGSFILTILFYLIRSI